MTLSTRFEEFCKSIEFDYNVVKTSCKEITKKLNSYYYDDSGNDSAHSYIVGSLGRKTGIKSTSDVDLIFDLPHSTFVRFNSYASNGQSALLQDVKEVLKERYSKTSIRGDGQVVVIEFSSFTVELVPAFLQSDNSFMYPDTHNGGSWKRTNPFAEQKATENTDILSNWIFRDFCRMLRCWKDENGIAIGGLLIDTICYDHFISNGCYSEESYGSYYEVLTDLFGYIKGLNKKQGYWFALGSNQKVYSSDNGFIDKASKAYERLTNAKSEDDQVAALVVVFGNAFPHEEKRLQYHADNTEQFIEQLFRVSIRYSVRLDCKVSQDGFRDFYLREALRDHHILRHNKKLTFMIMSHNVPEPYSIYWKVRNVGDEAIRRNMIRGQIRKTDLLTQREETNFQGPHYVECYFVKNGVCVARDRIDVPIGSF